LPVLKIAYFDCFSGISGDMCLGAIVDAGVSMIKLQKELKKIPIGSYKVRARRVKRAGFVATKVDVMQSSKFKSLRKWKDIERIIRSTSLSQEIRRKGLKVFRRLFRAEAEVHGKRFDSIHLHELSAVDCIIDIFGTIIGIDMLGVKKIYSSPINTGSGFIETDHGILPVPAPATAEILKNVPVYSKDIPFELTTPTGAAIIRELSAEFVDMPLMNIESIGIGAGNIDFKDAPNVLRLFVGRPERTPRSEWKPDVADGGPAGPSDEKVVVIETSIDDMNPQIYEYVVERLFRAGALDVYLTNILMKKGRPGINLTILCAEKRQEELMKTVLRETTTIGLRFYETKRMVLQREIRGVDTEYGKVRVKYSKLGNDIVKAVPEYEDCKRIAEKLNMPLVEVMKHITKGLNLGKKGKQTY